MRLLRGVMQAPFKDRKDPEYFRKLMERRRDEARARGEDTEEMYDDVDESVLRRNRVQPLTERDEKNQKRISYEA